MSHARAISDRERHPNVGEVPDETPIHGTIATFYGTASWEWSLKNDTARGIGSPAWAGASDLDGDGRDDLAWYEHR